MNCGTHFVSSPLLVSEVANSMPNVRLIPTELTITREKKNNECILSISCTIYCKNIITTTIYCFIKHSFVFVLMRQQAIPLANENWTSININNLIAKDCMERLCAVALSVGLIIPRGKCVSGHVVHASSPPKYLDRDCVGRRRSGTGHGNVYRSIRGKQGNITRSRKQ